MASFKAVGLTVFPIGCAAATGAIFGPKVGDKNDWYNKLIFPAYNPPDWMFKPVWATLYGLMGYSSYRILCKSPEVDVTKALATYGCQLAIGMAWTPVFFGAHKLKTSAAVVTAFAAGIAVTIKEFAPIDELASQLMYPAMAWVSFASVLGWHVAMLNEDNKALEEKKE